MATHGRHTFVNQALACFLRQDYANRELVILNNHQHPFQFDHTLVTIINEPGHPTLGHCRNRLLDFADGEFCRTWDDDDLYAPWCISQGVDHINSADAWKPTRSWWEDGNGFGSGTPRTPGTFELAANAMEASVTWRTAWVKSIGYHNGEGDEHRTLIQALGNIGPATNEMGEWASYCYRWTGKMQHHCSGSLGDTNKNDEQRAAEWQAQNQDIGDLLNQDYWHVAEQWRRLVRYIQPNLQTAWMNAARGHGPAHVAPLTNGSKRRGIMQLMTQRTEATVVAPGCWDLLHDGHKATLEWARQQGDRLIVLVNDDDGVAIQKGPGRPLVPLAGRIASLSSLDCVDGIGVVAGRDDGPVLRDLMPKFLVKGPEYAGRVQEIWTPPQCELRIAPPAEFRQHTSDLAKK